MLGCLDVGDTNLIKWSVCDLVSQYFCSEGTKKAVYSYLGWLSEEFRDALQ